MTGRGRSPVRVALRRLPRWVTALGLVLVLGEFTGGAALLAAGPHPGRGAHRGTGEAAPTQTVVLRVDAGDVACGGGTSCVSGVSWQTPAGRGSEWNADVPFVKKVQVPAGGSVTVTGDAAGQWLTCSITVGHTQLSRVTVGWNGKATCGSAIPDPLTMGPHGGTRGVALRVGENLGDTVTYTTADGDGRVVMSALDPSLPDNGNTPGGEPAITFTKSDEVQAGGTVTIRAVSPTGDAITSRITVYGAPASWADSGHSSSVWVRVP